MREMKEKVQNLLKDVPTIKKKIALLRYEWEHPQMVTPNEILESMVFSRGGEGGRPSVGHVSNKTYHIAVNYKDRTTLENRKQISDLATELERLERILYRLEYCVSQLPGEQSAIIRGLYFDEKGQKDLVEELHLSESSIQRYRDKAVDSLSAMYCTLDEAGVVLDW